MNPLAERIEKIRKRHAEVLIDGIDNSEIVVALIDDVGFLLETLDKILFVMSRLKRFAKKP